MSRSVRHVMRRGLRLLPAPLARALCLQGLRFVPGEVRDVVFKLAETREEREQAFRLVHDMYVRLHPLSHRPGGMWLSHFSVLPGTSIFVALRDSRVVGTVSLVEDSPLGVPMEQVHPEEIHRIRRAGERFAEVSALALDSGERRKGLSLMLYNTLFRWAHGYRDVRRLVIAVHPRAEPLYRHLMMFRRLGPACPYTSLQGAPSLPLGLELHEARARLRRLFHRPSAFFSPRDEVSNLYAFFCTRAFDNILLPPRPPSQALGKPPGWDGAELRYMFDRAGLDPRVLSYAAHHALGGYYPQWEGTRHAL